MLVFSRKDKTRLRHATRTLTRPMAATKERWPGYKQDKPVKKRMEIDPIKTKILADYKTLLSLKFNSPEVVYDKLKLISEHIQQLAGATPEEQEKLKQATTLLKSAMETGYASLHEALTNDDKEKALAEIKHKAAEACQLIELHG